MCRRRLSTSRPQVPPPQQRLPRSRAGLSATTTGCWVLAWPRATSLTTTRRTGSHFQTGQHLGARLLTGESVSPLPNPRRRPPSTSRLRHDPCVPAPLLSPRPRGLAPGRILLVPPLHLPAAPPRAPRRPRPPTLKSRRSSHARTFPSRLPRSGASASELAPPSTCERRRQQRRAYSSSSGRRKRRHSPSSSGPAPASSPRNSSTSAGCP